MTKCKHKHVYMIGDHDKAWFVCISCGKKLRPKGWKELD